MKRSRCKAIFLLILFVLNLSVNILPVYSDEPEQAIVEIKMGGKNVENISLAKNKKETLYAFCRNALRYQWQLEIPGKDIWVDIYDKSEPECEISYALLMNMLDSDNEAWIRCTAKGEDFSCTSDAVRVSITDEEETELSKESEVYPVINKNNTKKLYSAKSLLTSLAGTNDSEMITRTITIKYLYINEGPETQGTVANDYIATIEKGSDFTATVPSPIRTGYKPKIAVIGDWDDENGHWFEDDVEVTDEASKVNLEVDELNDNIVYYVVYVPQEMNFEISRYIQNIYDDFYTFADAYEKTGKVGHVVSDILSDDEDMSIEGFTMLKYADAKVAADGSTFVEVYYDRDYHLMSFELDGGYGVEPIYARYATEFTTTAPTKAGYKFKGWQFIDDTALTDEQRTIANDMASKLSNGEIVKIPSFDVNFKALWEAEDTTATVVYWYENANDDGYSYAGQYTIDKIKSGSTINSDDYKDCDFKDRDDEHFTYNSDKAEEVIVHGDGSTYLNIYFTRNVYTVAFTEGESTINYVDDDCSIPEHTHDNCFDGPHTPRCYGATTDNLTIPTNQYGYADFISKIKNPVDGMVACYINKDANKYAYYLYVGKWYYLGSQNVGDDPPTFYGIHWDTARQTTTQGRTYITYCLHHGATCYNNSEHCDIEEHIHGVSDNCEATVLVEGAGHHIYQIIQAKYMQDISAQWPLAGENYGYETVPSNVTSWAYLGYGSTTVTDQVTKQTNMIANLCNPKGQVVPYKLKYNPTPVQVNYWAESLTDEGETTYGNVKYNLDKRYSQKVLNPLTLAKSIKGLSYYGGLKTTDNPQNLYYKRKRYKITFNDGYGLNVATISDVMYEMPLNNVTYQGDPIENFVPPYPESLEKGIYEFDGWYTTPDCIPGTEADFDNTIMPDSDMIFYAKWKKKTHNVTFYNEYNDLLDEKPIPDDAVDDAGKSYGKNNQEVVHGDSVQYATTVSRNGYRFIGWFYIDDETGEKVAFLPNNMPVNKDLKIYAEWSKNDLIKYTIHYVGGDPLTDESGDYVMDEDGNYVLDESTYKPIAVDTTGQLQESRTKLFYAKALSELYPDCQEEYFPLLPNHSIMFSEDTKDPTVTIIENDDGTYSIEYTFYYAHLDEVDYTVNYINTVTGDNTFYDENGNSYKVDSVTKSTKDAVTTEHFKQIPLYAPDAYQKRLILTADSEKNVMNFYYMESSAPMYLVEHLTENIDGTWTVQASEFSSGNLGDELTRKTNSYVGHEFDPEQTWVDTYGNELEQDESDNWITEYEKSGDDYQLSATLESGQTTVMRFYYPLKKYPYTIEHRILKTGEYLFGDEESSTETGEGKYGDRFEGDASKYQKEALKSGYWVDGSREDSSRLVQSKVIKEEGNIITFWYVDEPVEINYRVVVDGKVGTNVNGNYVSPTLDNTSSHAKDAIINGSTPKIAKGYYFDGWYKDEACTEAVDSTWVDPNTNKIVPAAEGEDNIINATTYYAKIEPCTLTIEKTGEDVSDNETFMFHVEGEDVDIVVSVSGKDSRTIKYIPAGDYTVTEIDEWSWKYEDTVSQDITVENQKTVTFNNTTDDSKKWLNGENYIDNHFSDFKENEESE